MGLDHVHLHAAVSQECHQPHAAKTAKFLILWSVKQDAEVLTFEACGEDLYAKG